MKTCCRCKESKTLIEFGKRTRNKDGLEYFCKICKQKEQDSCRERRNELARKRYSDNKEFHIAKSSRTQYKKRGTILPQKFSDLLIKPIRVLKTWQDSLDRIRDLKRDNRGKYKEKYKKWASTDEAKTLNRLKSNRYKARKQNLINDLTLGDIKFLENFQDNRCGSCRIKFSDRKDYEIDHVVPVSKGGGTTLSNMQLLCVHCNRSKRDRIIRYIPKLENSIMSFGE